MNKLVKALIVGVAAAAGVILGQQVAPEQVQQIISIFDGK